jgi:hypothetical protein
VYVHVYRRSIIGDPAWSAKSACPALEGATCGPESVAQARRLCGKILGKARGCNGLPGTNSENYFI